MTVYEKNIIRHVGIVPMGGNVVNKDIRSYGILEKHVESLKTRYGGAMREKAQPDKFITTPGLSAKAPKEISCQNLAAIIEARMQDIIDFAIEEIKKSGYQNKLSAGVVLTGGGAQLRDLAALFKRYTGMDVRVAGPEAVLAADSPDEAVSYTHRSRPDVGQDFFIRSIKLKRKMSEERKLKVILSGGGTGGHIYPAVAVAEALGRRLGDRVDVLFVGAEGKMEMEKVDVYKRQP